MMLLAAALRLHATYSKQQRSSATHYNYIMMGARMLLLFIIFLFTVTPRQNFKYMCAVMAYATCPVVRNRLMMKNELNEVVLLWDIC